MTNALYYGDNLDVLRDSIASESVDLIYLDPPFNSNANYNVLFRSSAGTGSRAQIEAFEDTWHWGQEAESVFDGVMRSGNTDAADLLRAMRSFLGENDVMAYLAMMAVRLLELRRVLRSTGSLYLHCDPTASHYLKRLLDAVFGPTNFRNEVIWKRTGSHGSAKRWGPVHDTILFYTVSETYTWNRLFQPYEASYVEDKYRLRDARGLFQDVSLTGPGVRRGDSGLPWRTNDPTPKGRHWAIPGGLVSGLEDATSQDKLDALDAANLLYFPKDGEGFPRLKQYVGEGLPIQDVATDISAVNSQAQERMGYPTQKPVELLERILRASSNPGDVVLNRV